jgi:hypothetical protein
VKSRLSEKTETTLWATACFCFSLLVFAPSGLFLINQAAFSFNFKELLRCLIPLALLLTLVLSIPLRWLEGPLYKKIAVLLVALSFLIWFQGKVVGWPYGPLDGRMIPWKEFRVRDVIDAALWISVITVCTLRASFFYGLIRWVARILIFTQLASVAITAFQTQKGTADLSMTQIDQTSKFEFSKNKNVIILMLDEFQSDVFQEIIKQDKKFEDAFDGFTYFPNALAAFSITELAVPALLTGRFYDLSESQKVFLKEAFSGGSLPKVLKEHGFQVDLFPLPGTDSVYMDETIASNFKKPVKGKGGIALSDLFLLFKFTMLRSLPGPVKKFVYDPREWLPSGRRGMAKTGSGGPDGSKFQGLQGAFKKSVNDHHGEELPSETHGMIEVRPDDLNSPNIDLKFFSNMTVRARFEIEKNTFKYFHSMGMHPPLRLNEQMQTLPGIELNRKNYTGQAKAYLILCKRFLEVLKQREAYDNSLLLIMGDHGCGRSKDLHVGTADEPQGPDFPYNIARGMPLMLVKPFGSRGEMKISDAPVSLADIPKTVMSELKLESNFPGVSMFEPNYDIHRKRYFGYVSKVGASSAIKFITMCSVSGFSWLNGSWHEEGVLFPKNSKGFSKTEGKRPRRFDGEGSRNRIY